jgi:ABC-type nitrate/sulfonate/bicarbonate transport system permease component
VIALAGRPVRWRRVGLWLLGWAGLGVAALAWQLAASLSHSALVPTFASAAAYAWHLLTGPVLSADLLPSVARVLVGFGISAAIGITVGLLVGYYRSPREWTAAVFDFFRSLPTPLLIPVALVLFGLGGTMVVAVIVSAAVWPVLINTANATAGLEPIVVDTARSLGLRGPRLLARVILPAVSPQIFAGLRVAISVSLAVLVVAEILGGGSGIGYYIENAQQSFQITGSYAGVLVLCLLGWMADSLFLLAERRLLAWQRGVVGGGDA